MRELTTKVDPARITGVAISNQRETFGLFGEHGEPIRPAIVWLDERAIDQMRRFGASFGAEKIHAIVDALEADLMQKGQDEVQSSEIGERVMTELHRLDEVAYVRFASVYRRFKDLNQFLDELRSLLK